MLKNKISIYEKMGELFVKFIADYQKEINNIQKYYSFDPFCLILLSNAIKSYVRYK